jgi:hypothetical protein
MPTHDRDGLSGKHSRPATPEDGPRIAAPRCITNNAYKCWHPSREEVAPAAVAVSGLARNGHSSWFARMRFSLFHGWPEK